MKDEIKEILEDLRKIADNTIFVVCGSQEELDKMPKYTANFMSINDKKAKQLLDCITNLQEENQILKNIIEDNEENAKYLIRENKDLEKRIDKSIEYIEQCSWSNGIDEEIQYSLHIPTLLNILKGEDK